MEKTFTLGRNGYGDPKFVVKVFEDGRVVITEKDEHNGLPKASISLKPEDIETLIKNLAKD